ncbi:uncharacterized protein BDR25DRAFT_261679 [Lindgomyces ingoldianus]|uniref:Uncharacterized protein n=1 Tax=Lindgomyces ingoldianus TaxID=673940 RepID=A0ACB6QUC0_9PLEO|nr:uncharacterized protein BDR25DRAFT_261679 [Lindgomyces ingoldianus]KAF2470613.1 hypothetical protein BDR25DRAFT_261679 [Lindgomyces ingoldianus]
MSQWRLKGYVKDSDEEDEDLDTLSINSSPPVRIAHEERVAIACLSPTSPPQVHSPCTQNLEPHVYAKGLQNTPSGPSFIRQWASPAPSLEAEQRRETESPDPPQVSNRSQHSTKPPVTSQPIGVSNLFKLELLSESETDDDSSRPPANNPQDVVFLSPQRRTKVQVVIPQPPSVERESAEQRTCRSFRARRPIQLHPYLLEGERYRRECQRRGIKPVVRVRSPPRRSGSVGAETQEQDFHPEQESFSNSPLDVVRSTPSGSRANHDASSNRRSIAYTRYNSRRNLETHPPSHGSNVSARTSSTTNSDHGIGSTTHGDIWAIPHSPPYSSSPLLDRSNSALRRIGRHRAATPLPNLPTPSNSSSVRNDAQLVAEVDSDSSASPVQQVGTQRNTLISTILSDDLCSDSISSGTDSEGSESQIRRVGKRIKGVLPASWLRLNRQAQEKRQEQARERKTLLFSLGKVEAQRGVAQRVTKRPKSLGITSSSTAQANEVIVISDESDDEPAIPFHADANDIQQSAKVASEMAATLDQRYAVDDVDNMENDRLQLFPLGGNARKRRRQTKLTDTFSKPRKKSRLFEDDFTDLVPSVGVLTSRRQRQKGETKRNIHTLPSLSILDVDETASQGQHSVPQFIRLANRQARRRSDKARQSPHNKYIRLHTYRETEEATLTLRRWRAGSIKPTIEPGTPTEQRPDRIPLSNRIDNQQHTQLLPDSSKHSAASPSTSEVPKSWQERRKRSCVGLLVSRGNTHVTVPFTQLNTRSSSSKKAISNHIRQHSPFRAAQLEGLEVEFGRSNRRIAFERGLQNFDKQYRFQMTHEHLSRNPQLFKFLTSNAVFPPLPTVKDMGEKQTASRDAKSPVRKPRIARKFQARRIDADTREFRQPSEPTLQDHVLDATANTDTVIDLQGLQGLPPFGTRFPTTFDVTPLAVGTYFETRSFLGSEEFRRSLQTGHRDLDLFAGHLIVHHDEEETECGPWNEATYSRIAEWSHGIWQTLDNPSLGSHELVMAMEKALQRSSEILRSLITYFSAYLSFSDVVDRRNCTSRMKQFLESLFSRTLQAHALLTAECKSTAECSHQSVRTLTYLLVLSMQVREIARHSSVEPSVQTGVAAFMSSTFQTVVEHLVRKGVPELGDFLERIKSYKERENGIRDNDILAESLVICMHMSDLSKGPGEMLWDAVSQELSRQTVNATQFKAFESIWVTAFTFLPFSEFDPSGIFVVNRRASTPIGSWTFVKDLLKRLFSLYPDTVKLHDSSMNEYIRATLTRCHVLIRIWNWTKCEPMLSAVFDFFGKRGLRQLQHEEGRGSPRFLENFSNHPSLDVVSNDSAFHIFLKCLALGLKAMPNLYPEKKIRSIVLRCTPNHGRGYPKDQPMAQADLDSLRNHHDLLCTLHLASPPSCRPKVDIIRGLVYHETSHREACRLSVRAWAILAAFQLSVDEPYAEMQPLALWHKEIIQHTLKQYKLANIEAEEYFKSAQSDGTTKISAQMVRTTVNKNQAQVIATIRDCIAGMQNAIKSGSGRGANFLTESGIIQLLELADVDDPRLTIVIRETLYVLKEFAALRQRDTNAGVDQQTSEESQDYGEFPELDDVEGLQQTPSVGSLEFIETPLWHLLSNAFGAERPLDDGLLKDCVDTWVLIVGSQVSARERSWDHYIDSFSQVSWHQLRDTIQTRKFTPYFMASLVTYDSRSIKEHQREFFTAWLVSLVERESMLRFQHRLTKAIVQVQSHHPLLQNLPFLQDPRTGHLDVTFDTLRTRRLALLSSILANMRDDLHTAILDDPSRVADTKREYASMLKELMNAMKKNYQDLRHGTTVIGAYVEFVQKIVQFLQQYTSDICAVSTFFTDSAAFPLPATDPTYVVGRLCGYAPKLASPGVAKQLSTFIQTVAQQAALDSQQPYLVNQLSSALSANGPDFADGSALRRMLLQGVFPAYIKASFESAIGLVIAKPILQSLKSILDALFFDLRVTDTSNVRCFTETISAVLHAFVQGAERLIGRPFLLNQVHVLQTIEMLLDASVSILPMLDYIQGRTSRSVAQPPFIAYLEQFSIFVSAAIHNKVPDTVPGFDGPTNSASPPCSDLLFFSIQGLQESMNSNWKVDQGRIFFGQGHARREVFVDLGLVEEEKAITESAIERFHQALRCVYGDEFNERYHYPMFSFGFM